MSAWTFTVAQTERGWDVGGYDDAGNSLPQTCYPNAYKAAARMLQLFGWRDFGGPVEKLMLPTPIMKEAADEIERLRAEVAGLREFVEHVRRNGSTHLANMAVAVLAARKGEA